MSGRARRRGGLGQQDRGDEAGSHLGVSDGKPPVSLGDKNECRFGADRYDRSAYRECLAEVVGLSADTVAGLAEPDLALCRLLDIRFIQDGKWDDKSALGRFLSEVA